MSDASWPAIPYEPEQSDYREVTTPNVSSFKPDVGPPTTYRRSTLDMVNIQATFVLTGAERATFLTFYRTTLQDGILPFLWTNPAFGASARYLFDPDNPPQWASAGFDLWRLTVSVIKLS